MSPLEVRQLLDLAKRVYEKPSTESKFERLRGVLTDPRWADEKFIIFTEHRDTLIYLVRRLEGMGYTGHVAQIHGGMDYQDREEQVERFRKSHHEGGCRVLVATDAAGEGINLQFCWLMVNWDIPWNPARLEQRMGRIHRYGQKHDPVGNVNVLTTGFDAPSIDCVALVRPTLSPGLYYQMVGRGFRLCEGKTDCLILDFGGNVLRHGPVDQVRVDGDGSNGTGPAPAKECPECHEIIAASYAQCPACGHVFPPPERRTHDGTATSAGILSDQASRTEYEVEETFYAVHVKRDAPPDAPRTMRVDYRVGFNDYVSEWVCFEHDGYARQKAVQWWRSRSNEPVPDTAEQAVELAEMGALAPTRAITVMHKPGDKYDRIVGYRLGDKPARLESSENLPEYVPPLDESEVPF